MATKKLIGQAGQSRNPARGPNDGRSISSENYIVINSKQDDVIVPIGS